MVKKKSVKAGGKEKKKLKRAVIYLVSFALLTVVSLILYDASVEEIYVNTFLATSIVLGFISLAFLIAVLMLYFTRYIRK